MKVLVIGGTGNISRGIVAALQHRNYEVVLFNRGQHRDAPHRQMSVSSTVTDSNATILKRKWVRRSGMLLLI